jgi:hypothetical protein
MFKSLKRLAKNAANLKTKVLFRIIFSDKQVQDLIIDLNRFNQLFKESELADGSIIDKNYSRLTEQVTRETGGVFTFRNSTGETFKREKTTSDPYFLLDSGEFYKSFKVKILDDGFVVQADTIKDDGTDLTKYGEILGLTNESKDEIIKKILPMVIQETRKAITG